MAEIFISSTVTDLQEARHAVYVAIRRLGHESVALEDWAASAEPPLERSLNEVRRSDALVCIVGWRYGYVPPGYDRSTVELELNAALEAGVPCLVFLLRDETYVAPRHVDPDQRRVLAFRERLLNQFVVGLFADTEELAMLVAVAIHRWTAEGSTGKPVVPTEEDVSAGTVGPEVFLSYAHEDVTTAQDVSRRLVHESWSVFWDRQIPVGTTWDDIVEAALDSATCVVVLWSAASRNSEWVRIEANEGAERQILAPALISETKIPLRFRRIQAANLVGWSPAAGDTEGMKALIQAVRRCIGAVPRDAA